MAGPDPLSSGFAQGVAVTAALEKVGVVPTAWVWRWRPGRKGGVFPDHYAINGLWENDILNFPSLPQADVNGDYCECLLQTIWRDTRTGRFARPPSPRLR